SRYLHDVFEDFERHRAVCDGEHYIINNDCKTLRDFLSPDEPPELTKVQLQIMENDELPEMSRWAAFTRIRDIRKSAKNNNSTTNAAEINNDNAEAYNISGLNDNGRRFKAVAEECIALVTSTLKKE
ncbi:hypothetical protein, partial [Methylobacterium frigidaeris]